MRIKLEKGRQKQLLINFRDDHKLTWDGVAEILQVKPGCLKPWVAEKNLLPLPIYNKLDINGNFKKYIVELKEKNWGQKKGAKQSSGKTKDIKFPNKNKELAELIGIILGDGNIHIFKGKKSTSYMVRIAGDSRHDYNYLINYVKPLCENLFSIKAKTFKAKNRNELFVILNSKKAVEFLISLGLSSGDKIKNQVTIPLWIFENKKFLKACLRGLIDTDGSVYELKTHWPGLYQINFTNANLTLLNDVKRGFDSLEIKCSRVNQSKNRTPRIYISSKEAISKFYKEVGFNNFKHKNKLKNSPVV